MLTDLRTAFCLLTRLPIKLDAGPDLARCVWGFPIVGVVVNGAGAVVYWAAHKCGMAPMLAAAWTLAATMFLTGALHEDGLADTADGFGGGVGKCRKLRIMRDSRIGSYGALALMLSTLIRSAGTAAIAQPLTALIAAGALGRSAMIVPLLLLSPAREDGMGASISRPPARRAAVGLALAVVATLLLLPARTAVTAVVVAAAGGLFITCLARSQIGGHTGDVLGATEIITECVVLSAIASAGTP